MHRHPARISAELSALHEAASLAFVPANVRDALALCVEFCASVAHHLGEARAIADEPAPPAAPPEAVKLPEVGTVDLTHRAADVDGQADKLAEG